MKRVILATLLAVVSLFAQVQHLDATTELVESGLVVIDIRTETEWAQTGIVKDAVTITFFDERGNYDTARFLEAIAPHVDRQTPFALICRTGNRTTMVSDFLSQQGYGVINLRGGIRRLIDQEGYATVPFRH